MARHLAAIEQGPRSWEWRAVQSLDLRGAEDAKRSFGKGIEGPAAAMLALACPPFRRGATRGSRPLTISKACGRTVTATACGTDLPTAPATPSTNPLTSSRLQAMLERMGVQYRGATIAHRQRRRRNGHTAQPARLRHPWPRLLSRGRHSAYSKNLQGGPCSSPPLLGADGQRIQRCRRG